MSWSRALRFQPTPRRKSGSISRRTIQPASSPPRTSSDGSAAAQLAGKLVLIGTSASGLLDLKATPIQPSMAGVEVHAQVLENVLTQIGLVASGLRPRAWS